jgi:Glycosyl hydrolase family 26
VSTPTPEPPKAAAARRAADEWTVAYGDERAAQQAAVDALQYAALQREFEDYREAHPDYLRPTLFGSSVNGPLFKTLGYRSVPITRVFLRQLPNGSRWESISGDAKATSDLANGCARATDVLWVSFKEADPALVNAFFASKPEGLGLEVWGTFHHEPEDEAPGYPPARFVTEFRAIAPVLRRYGVKSVPVFMRYTLQPASGRKFTDWWPGVDYVDVLGFDSYNLANKKATYSDVASQLVPVADLAKAFGIPWAIGETGASIFNGDAKARADWAAALADQAEALDAAALAWWDQDSYVFDKPTAQVWLGAPS